MGGIWRRRIWWHVTDSSLWRRVGRQLGPFARLLPKQREQLKRMQRWVRRLVKSALLDLHVGSFLIYLLLQHLYQSVVYARNQNEAAAVLLRIVIAMPQGGSSCRRFNVNDTSTIVYQLIHMTYLCTSWVIDHYGRQ